MPRPRFTLRWLMVAVAIVGAFCGLAVWAGARRGRFEALSRDFVKESYRQLPRARDSGNQRKSDYYQRLGWKYAHAARYPWLPVEPDPPEPE